MIGRNITQVKKTIEEQKEERMEELDKLNTI